MRVSIQVESDHDGVDGADLLRWLRKDPIAAQTQFSIPSADEGRGEMGVPDTVQAVLESAVGLGSLLVAVAAWRDARRQNRAGNTAAVVRVRTGSGTVEITGDDPSEVSRLVQALTTGRPGVGGDASAE
ncbi:hypothetical protein ABZ349_06275 [Streptomyces niveus]|uniref:effector-associated constant component EACC1 n=1 Tax=Streptomyces niveus TaxID=193462 RepID=UPI0033E339F0